MDITKTKEQANARFTKRVPVSWDENGDEVEGFIIVNKDSKEYRDAAAQVRASAIRRQTNRKTKIDRTTEEGALKLDEVLQGNEHILALAVVVGWFGFTVPGPNNEQVPAELDKAVVEELFRIKPTWREKVSLALEEDEGFLAT